ncbi:MAG: AmmeMemoRadiSam system radical SAM enzyme [Candidatus Omnitrophica bacterium]|nr:AmmeMemoRadiSam system radical SAM enzyme [Candidatus Omnitrophota bacterium]
MKKEALLYERLEDNKVRCLLCAHQCEISEDKFGLCGVRQNIKGVLYTYAYQEVVAANIDPIEKKPLYHFFPGSFSFSIATFGCNFRCGFCQNWEISQRRFKDEQGLRGEVLTSEEIVGYALRNRCKSISYTYTEPTVFFEYAYQTAKLAKEKGLYNNFVTNGFMSKECLEMIKPYLDAANVDLKFFKEQSYQRICRARLKPVLDSIILMHKLGIWVEITTLVVPDENDSEEELKDIAQFIADIDKDIPWHVSRFHPDYKFTNYRSTPEKTLKKAQELGFKAGLNYVYVGNVIGFGNDTYCPNCKNVLIRREIFSILENHIKEGRCPSCNTKIAGIF